MNFNFIRDKNVGQSTHTIYMQKTGFNLAIIDELDTLILDLISNKITLKQANLVLNNLEKSISKVYGRCLTALGYAMAGFGFAGFLRCTLIDLILSALLSVFVYVVLSVLKKYSNGYGVPFLCSFFVGVVSTLISILLPNINIYLISLSALIYLIPGFVISSGIIEISYKYVLSGIINIVNGIVQLIVIFFGVYLGFSIVNYVYPIQLISGGSISQYWVWPLALVMSCGLSIIFQVPKKYFSWSIISIFFICLGMLVGRLIGGINVGNLVGSVIAVIFANYWSNKYNHAASILLIPSVVFLVSGSIGFRGFVALSSHNIHLGVNDLMQMFIVAITIAIGLSIGSSLYKPKISL